MSVALTSRSNDPLGGAAPLAWHFNVGIRRHLLPIGFFLFLSSISRVALGYVPPSTNLFWGIAYLGMAVSVMTRPETYLALAARNAVLLLGSAFTILSALWSLAPSQSAYSGVLLLLNVLVGSAIFLHVGLRQFIVFVFYYNFIVLGLSTLQLAIGDPSAVDPLGNFVGLYVHKNNLAMYACVLYFTSVLLLASGWRPLLSAAGIALALNAVLQSRSGTSTVMLAVLTVALAACGVAASGRRRSSFLSGMGLMALVCAAMAIMATGYDVSHGVLGALGKDGTLTGRTILWEQAVKSYDEHPWFGIGYDTFWGSPETAASYLWVVTGQLVTSFHNIYLDRLVDVGLIGLGLFVGSLLILLWRSLRGLLDERSAVAAWPLVYTIYLATIGFSEYPMFWNCDFQLMLSVAAAATCGVRRTGLS
jgi:exopolysaccharide production protein ExoQ